MRKLLCTTLLALMLLPGVPATADSSRGRFTTLFCPECWTYLYAHGSTDLKGNCAECGKYPLEMEVRVVRATWCERQHRWLAEPCAEQNQFRCCTSHESLATPMRPGPGLMHVAYCPEHRSFNGIRLPLLGTMVCAVDSRPMMSAWAARRTWFWCESDGQWAASPCSMDGMKHCCTPRSGLLLAMPEPGPLAGE